MRTLLRTTLVSQARANAEDDYTTLLGYSLRFYEAQMSGTLPTWNRFLASAPGGWKKNSHLNDGAPIGANLAGGFYDAGGT
jgi:endoglucanase